MWGLCFLTYPIPMILDVLFIPLLCRTLHPAVKCTPVNFLLESVTCMKLNTGNTYYSILGSTGGITDECILRQIEHLPCRKRPLVSLPVDPSMKYFSRCGNETSACYQRKFHARNTFQLRGWRCNSRQGCTFGHNTAINLVKK